MSKLDDAKTNAESYIDEIAATLEIRHAYTNIIISNAAHLFIAFKDDRFARSALQTALKYKTVDPGAFYKPLIVQLNGVFESYIRAVVRAIIEEKFETADTYSDLEKSFRDDHVSHAARILSFVKSGSVMGSPYNFDLLLSNIGNNLTNQKPIKLNPEIYTKLMGNCTATRLEALFSALALPEPFSEPLGRNAELKAHFADRAKGRVADRAREELDRQIDLRNDIVHGEPTRAVDLAELNESLSFFKALIAGLGELLGA